MGWEACVPLQCISCQISSMRFCFLKAATLSHHCFSVCNETAWKGKANAWNTMQQMRPNKASSPICSKLFPAAAKVLHGFGFPHVSRGLGKKKILLGSGSQAAQLHSSSAQGKPDPKPSEVSGSLYGVKHTACRLDPARRALSSRPTATGGSRS